jgi:hypothetical protein
LLNAQTNGSICALNKASVLRRRHKKGAMRLRSDLRKARGRLERAILDRATFDRMWDNVSHAE